MLRRENRPGVGAGEAVRLREAFPSKVANAACGLHADRDKRRRGRGGWWVEDSGCWLAEAFSSSRRDPDGSHGPRAQRGCPLMGAGLILRIRKGGREKGHK